MDLLYILFSALLVALLSLVVACLLYLCYRRTVREKNRDILRHIRKQDALIKQLERAVYEKEALRELFRERERDGPHCHGKTKDKME